MSIVSFHSLAGVLYPKLNVQDLYQMRSDKGLFIYRLSQKKSLNLEKRKEVS